MLTFTIVSLDHARSVYGTDLDLQQALNDGCRVATMQVDPYSQAHNDPLVKPQQAHAAFRDVMSGNLNLNDMTPKPNSPIVDIDYVFVVLNGRGDYGLPYGYVFTSDNPVGYEIPWTDPLLYDIDVGWIELPVIVWLSGTEIVGIFNNEWYSLPDDELTAITDQSIMIEAKNSGCIAVARASLKPILGKTETRGTRWSYAVLKKDKPMK